MTFDPLFDLRRLLGDFSRIEFTDTSLQRFLLQGASEAARRGLLVQEQEVIDVRAGVVEYALHPRWVQTFAVLHEDIQGYLAMRDQASVVWYLSVTEEGSLVWSDTKPSGVDLSPVSIPYWFRWESPDAGFFYCYPSLLGSTSISDTQPPIGAGISLTLELQSRLRLRWLAGVSDQSSLTLEAFAGVAADLRVTPTEATSIALIIPEAFGRLGRITPAIPPGHPKFIAIWKGRMWVSPTPDANYELDHKFFAIPLASGAQVYTMTEAFRRLPALRGFSLALRSQGRLEASRAVMRVFEQLMFHLAIVYRASARESQDEVALPT